MFCLFFFRTVAAHVIIIIIIIIIIIVIIVIDCSRILVLQCGTQQAGGHEDFVGEQKVAHAGICSETNITTTQHS